MGYEIKKILLTHGDDTYIAESNDISYTLSWSLLKPKLEFDALFTTPIEDSGHDHERFIVHGSASGLWKAALTASLNPLHMDCSHILDEEHLCFHYIGCTDNSVYHFATYDDQYHVAAFI